MIAPAPPRRPRLSVVLSHPVQYYSPWFRQMQADGGIDVHVHYLSGSPEGGQFDPQFGQDVRWDVPLLDGYAWSFVPNRSADPGPHHFPGLDNPDLVTRLAGSRPDAILFFGYAYRSHLRALLAPALARIPLLLRGDSHDMGRARGWKPAVMRQLRRVVFKRFAGFLAVGAANAAYFRACGVQGPRIHFAPHCVDNQRFQAGADAARLQAIAWRRELGIADDARVLLFAGKFEDKKRPLDLLTAFLKLQAEGGTPPGAALLFVGNGMLDEPLRAMAASATPGSVFFAPFQNQTSMPRVYAAGDVMVLPSFGAGETWGLAVNEAMNLARPVIVSSHVGCGPDLVQPGATGWIFEAGNVAALSQIVGEALSLPADRLAAMGRAARRRVDGYSYAEATAGLMAAMRSVGALAPPASGDRPK
ncbi:glycosyltransferase family 4 protein [Cognatilysobacter lacus]|uniref:Glycosyltransferase family 4 protein n=1 Tax=Cognatilysobacter lacus TaxID=1643323 RepID=A0A5D8YTM7_9GAMM|nr:glycosyltransferase family 4 protein [Lysobacter lacus]TZF85233.1 glycosyltransferase family 4 protein [Lysobacter lacus]